MTGSWLFMSENRQIVDRKNVWILLFLISLTGCHKSEIPSFLRISCQHHVGAAPGSDLNLREGFDGAAYHSFRNVTIPFFCQASRVSFRCEKSGFSRLYIRLLSKAADELALRIKSAAGVLQKSYSLKPGLNELLVKNRFWEGDEISIASKSGNPFVAAHPIFFTPQPETKRELIFLISVDTLAAAHMSLYGYHAETTPHLRRFARDALVFQNAFSNSSWTVSSHMSLFTSLLEDGHRVRVRKEYVVGKGNRFDLKNKTIAPLAPSIPTLTESLAVKYLTFAFNGGANLSASFGFYRGFDLYRSHSKDMTDAMASARMFARVQAHLREFLFPKAFYFLHTYHVHTPYHPPVEPSNGEKPISRISRFDFYSDLGGVRGIYKPYPKEFVVDVVRLYDEEIAHFDSAFSAFINYLQMNQLYDNSTIILLSDHGEEFLEHSSWVHGSNLYAPQIWIPLLIKFPGREHGGKHIGTPVSLIDVLPTLLACKGLYVPGKIQGQSLMDLITGKGSKRPPVVSTMFRCKPEKYFPGKIAMIDNGFKLIEAL